MTQPIDCSGGREREFPDALRRQDDPPEDFTGVHPPVRLDSLVQWQNLLHHCVQFAPGSGIELGGANAVELGPGNRVQAEGSDRE